jgi:hypothetical protein
MRGAFMKSNRYALRHCAVAALAFTALVSASNISRADEGGVSFWIPGFFGSLAAAPQQPGWSLAIVNYYTNVSAGGNVVLAREFAIKNLPAAFRRR